jgi:ribosome-binding protein aMBF1 (putative translation factor)
MGVSEDEVIDMDIDVESGEVKEVRAKGIQEIKKRGLSEELKRPLDWKKKQVVSELIDNFHWHISHARRQKGLMRKQFAEAIGESEEVVKKIENGVLPENSFVLVNKIQNYLRINLRKDRKDFSQPMRKLVEKKQEEKAEEKRKEFSAVIGDDIEVIEEG